MEELETLAEGLLVLSDEKNHGFLRLAENSYAPSHQDVYVPPDLIRQHKLRPADRIMGPVRPPKDRDKYRGLTSIISINKKDPPKAQDRPFFEKLTPTYPHEQIRLEYSPKNLTTRIIDLVCPIGFGQRCLVVAPPKAGKTVLLKDIALSIQHNYPQVILVVLLIDERPEEVTDMRSAVTGNGQVVASTFDEQPERHVEVAEVVIERAKRMAEMDGHVVVLLDSITRLARAYNTITPVSGRILSGGMDARSLPAPKKIFGAARNLQGAGSITIIGTALVDTGSKMDEVIFEEFKGTGNAELHLDRRLMEKRIFPSIDISKSGTRKEELLLDQYTLTRITALRQALGARNAVDAMESVKQWVEMHQTNGAFLDQLGKKL